MARERERVRPTSFTRGPVVQMRGGGSTGSYLVTCVCGKTTQVMPRSYRANRGCICKACGRRIIDVPDEEA